MSEHDGCEFYVGHGVNLSGATITIAGTARIDGTMDGTIKAGHLIVGAEGKLKGEITTDTAEIQGFVEQTLSVANLLTVKTTGMVNGTVVYGELQCEQGGKLIGELSTNSSSVARADRTVVSISDE